jgi:hypothetical protein
MPITTRSVIVQRTLMPPSLAASDLRQSEDVTPETAA